MKLIVILLKEFLSSNIKKTRTVFDVCRLSIFLVVIVFGCEEKKSVFYPELTESSIPQEGILPYFKGEVMDPYWVENQKYPIDLRRFPNITLESHLKEEVKEGKLLGKYKLITFFYAKCNGICPMITRNMINFLPRIENQSDLEIYSITINPEVDSVEVLQNFREQYKIKQTNWTFLTGSKKDIYEMARKQFSADVKVIKGADNLNDFVHTENIYLLDKQNYLRGIYRAKGTGDLERLLVELKTLREEGK
ncbi:MAG: SCO family protein [Leptospiraceae bacterium]|nr:SCO family protein [Leptospiraceae bacterium]